MNNLILKEKQNFMGIEIPVIEGGFGEDQKVMLAKTISEIHGVELKFVNLLINNNLDEFEEGIDILDLKNSVVTNNQLLQLGFTKQSIANSKNIYLLSEQGYMALVGLMRTDKAKEIRRRLRREYFSMRANRKEEISSRIKEKEIEARYNNSVARRANAILKVIKDNPLMTKEEKQRLQIKATEILLGEEKIEHNLQKEERKTYTATEIGKMLGMSANKVGRLVKANNLKTHEFGEFFRDKAKYSSKEVQSFRYYDNIIPVLKGLINQSNNS
ncbi:ORF6N domain-containing protein [Clostridium perfringens]|uniref:ORF6N domain-containing protein n=1 Tax=Clostridium perfringens TaxID=1502 RepID=UPI0030CF47FC|nr:ORF6N domain-containing protein [Clostridium perfringens]MDM0588412.1 ORF6N domain-containing protein [Clostridium perfringens]